MFCNRCGTKNDNDSKFCMNCGNKLIKTLEYKQISLIFGIVCMVCAIFFNTICVVPGIIGIIYGIKNKKEVGKYGAGFVLSIVGMVLGVLIVIITTLLVFLIAFSEVEDNNSPSTEIINGIKIDKF